MSTEFNIEALPININYVCETTRDDNWKCDQWHVTIRHRNGFFTTDYFTGLGHRKPGKSNWDKTAKPVAPKKADVLYSLFSDANAKEYNFNDWCDEFGYSSDSIKALNVYKACLETAVHLRKCFDAETTANIQAIIHDM